MFELKSTAGGAVFLSEEGARLRIAFPTMSIARITYVEGREFSGKPSRIVLERNATAAFEVEENGDRYRVFTKELTVEVGKANGALRYLDARGLLVSEPERGGKWLTPKDVVRHVFAKDSIVSAEASVDGARASGALCETVVDRQAFEAKLEFVFSKEEALFGLGSHEEGYGNLRGRSRELYQQNMKAVVPYFVSTRGFGVLLDCCSLMTFHDDANGSYWWADVVDELDYYVIRGNDFDGVTREYYNLTGNVPMLPKWAFGFVQSKERYVCADELVDVVREYRKRKVPLDAVVLDWKSWPNGGGWGQKSFDALRFPDPCGMTARLHELGAKLMVSIWPIMTGGCENQSELLARGGMLGNQSTYDAFSEEARACYWEQTERGLFQHGVDGWWCDCTEPFEADWTGAVKPEPHLRLSMNTAESKRYIDAGDINAYSLMHSQGVYEGQRRVTEERRVVNLTRSAYAGQHRYGTITWNGDVCSTWETLRRCIPEGLNFCATGEPFWTVDAGGFFVGNDHHLWFWRGDYAEGCRGLTDMNAMEPDPNDTGCKDKGFWEIYVRWMQYAAFLPMFRSHGTDAAREIWRFGEEGEPFYDAIAAAIRLRYRLMAYIYSLAAQVTMEGSAMVRAVGLEFPEDSQTHDLMDQFMFGRAMMICPVTEPMYFGPDSREILGVQRSRSVYLPEGTNWFDFSTGELYSAGRQVIVAAPLERIPIFVRAGSIVPMSEVMQHTGERPDAPYEIYVYPGKDAVFDLYEDSGDGYGYERGEYALIRVEWNEFAHELKIGAVNGEFPERVRERVIRLVCHTKSGAECKEFVYQGKAMVWRIGKEPVSE